MTASASGKAPRQTRTRKPAATAPDAVAVSAQPKAAPAKTRTRKPAVQAEPTVAPTAVVDLRTPAELDAEVAFTAYLLWEQGTPGDADSHWYAAEALVRS